MNDQVAPADRLTPVVFLPGIIMPAALRYAPLLRELENIQPVVKDLKVYATDAPPQDYSIDQEVEAVSRAADDAGLDRFHLYGHSAGGAIALAYVARNPGRVLSLAIDEPATDFSDVDKAILKADLDRIAAMPVPDQMRAFMQMQLAPGVELPSPPSGPAPEWMALRPAGIAAFTAALMRQTLAPDALSAFSGPVYYSLGSLSHPHWQSMRDRLEASLPNFRSELYEGIHHMNTSHQAQPARVAAALQSLWSQ